MNIYHDPALQKLKEQLTGLEEPQQEEVDTLIDDIAGTTADAWLKQSYFSVFDDNSSRIPVSFTVEEHACFVIATGEERLQTFISSTETKSEYHIKPVVIADLLRGAIMSGQRLFWADADFCVHGRQLYLLAKAGFATDKDGRERLYSVEAPALETDQPALTDISGSLQFWYYQDGGEGVAEFIVYDETQGWDDNAFFQQLDYEKIPLSKLSSSEMHLFFRSKSPLTHDADIADDVISPAGVSTLVPEIWLNGFRRFQRRIDGAVIPPAEQLFVDVKPVMPTTEEQDAEPRYQMMVEYYQPDGSQTYLSDLPVYYSAEQLKALELPAGTGRYPIPAAMRNWMINQLSWYQFYRAGDLLTPMGSLYRWNFILEINDVEPVSPSLEDPRFPCLAQFSHNELSIPVLLLKEEQDTMVCMLLESQEVSYEYATLFGELLDEQAPPASFHLFSDSLYRLPASGMHYPESLYTGVWIHAGTMLEHADKMVWESWEEREQTRMQLAAPLQIKAPVNKGAMAGCLVITIGLVALAITFFAFMVSLFL